MFNKRAAFFAAMAGLAMVAGAASAQPTVSSVPPRAAPAPLLAAGIPAFVALGGAAVFGRVMRRRKGSAESNEPAANE
jgi:hypothetical protein